MTWLNRYIITKQRGFTYYANLLNLKYSLFMIVMLNFFSCSENPKSYIEHLNGYWEIEIVILPNGSKKVYTFNETIDYISFNDSLKGFRKKLKPSINNTYLTSDDAETITLKIESDSLHIYYATPYANWRETVLEATSEKLMLINKNNIVYLYKRYNSIHLNVE